MKNYLSIVFSFLLMAAAMAQPDAHTILKKTKAFYQTRDIGQARISSRFKSAIAESSGSTELTIVWCRSQGILANLYGNNELLLLTQKRKLYSIDREKKSVIDLSRLREERLTYNRRYPFFDSSFINGLFKKEWLVTNIDNSYQLQNKGTTITIDSSDYSIRSYLETEVSAYGIQILEWKVLDQQYPKDISQTVIPGLLNDISSFTKTKEAAIARNPKWTGKNVKDLLPDSLFLKRRFILFDFFYQSCMPCIASFPRVKALQKEFPEEMFTVKGIDPIKEDSSSMNAFKKRYGLDYELISGVKARALNEIFNPRHIYPFYLLVDADGKVREAQEGLDERFFDRVRKIISRQ